MRRLLRDAFLPLLPALIVLAGLTLIARCVP